MNSPKKSLKTGIPALCPCCGGAYLKAAEASLVIALYSAVGAKSAREIAAVTGGNERTIRRTIMARRNWVERTESLEKSHGCPQGYRVVRYSLSSEGHLVAERITGRGSVSRLQ